MIADLLAGLPASVLIALDMMMIIGALGGLAYFGERLIDVFWPANPTPPAHMRTADAKRIESDVDALWGREVTRIERVRAGEKLRPSYPKQPPATNKAGGPQPEPPRTALHLVEPPPKKP